MLKQRIVTALLLVPLVVCSVLWLETPYLALVLVLPVLLASIEWAALAGVTRVKNRILYMALMAAGLAIGLLVGGQGQAGLWILSVAACWWGIALFRMFHYRLPAAPEQGIDMLRLMEGLIVLIPAWIALVKLHAVPQSGPAMALFLLVLIWMADTGAYFAGRRWGRVKLAPLISPGKTWEGGAGALAGALLCGLVMSMLQGYSGLDSLLFILLCLLTTAFSVVGDLFESIVKRRRGVKDSGQLLPGHGGMLDRIDSLTAAAPIFVLGFTLVGIAP